MVLASEDLVGDFWIAMWEVQYAAGMITCQGHSNISVKWPTITFKSSLRRLAC